MENRRVFERFGSDMIFWIKAKDATVDYEPFEIENISAGGIRARTQAQFQGGVLVQMNFELPQYTDLISAEAIVRHVHMEDDGYFRVGLEFVNVDNLDTENLIRYLEEIFK